MARGKGGSGKRRREREEEGGRGGDRERYFDWLNSWTKMLTNSGRFLTNTVRSQRRKTVRKLKLATKRMIIGEVHNKTCDKQFRCLRSTSRYFCSPVPQIQHDDHDCVKEGDYSKMLK